jgi:CheY-like chemotaxis protein
VTLILFEGWAWMAAGLVALARRPDTPAGLWMIAAGFSWLWGALEFANPDVLETLGAAFGGTLFPFILHVFVGFPTSVRLTGAARALLATAWSTWVVTALSFALWPVGAEGCETCSREVVPIAPGAPGSEVISVLGNGLGAIFVLAAVMIVLRRQRAIRAGRRGLDEAAAPVAVAGLVITAVIALDVLARTALPSLERATAARDLRPDLLLVDVGLPDGDGFEVAERLRGDPACPPAIVFTSNRDAAGFARRIATCGAAGFVAKDQLTGRALAELLA